MARVTSYDAQICKRKLTHKHASACAPSKLNDTGLVPTFALTVATSRVVPPRCDAAVHVTVVPVVHDVLLHVTESSSDVVAVTPFKLKFSPETVTAAPPVCATLDGSTPVATGAAQNRFAALR
jgi:hypothetical protein